MKKTPIIDGHIDLAWNYVALNREFENSVEIKRNMDSKYVTQFEGIATVGYPEIKNANIRMIFATIWVESDKSLYPSLGPKYSSLKDAKVMAEEQFNYYTSLCEKNQFSLVTTKKHLKNILYNEQYCFGIVPIIEGADFILDEVDLNYWIKKGIRIVAPIWQKNHFGGCSELNSGLTKKGKEFIKILSKKNIIIDIAHMSDQSINDVFKLTKSIVINSHTCCRHFCNSERMISDKQILKIHEHNGVIGLMTWGEKLNCFCHANIDDYINQIKHIKELTGCVDNIAIGSSMDGGYGKESLPLEMDNIGSLSLLTKALLDNSFSVKEIQQILYKNWERVLISALDENL